MSNDKFLLIACLLSFMLLKFSTCQVQVDFSIDTGFLDPKSSKEINKTDTTNEANNRTNTDRGASRGIRITVRLLRQLGYNPATAQNINLAGMNVSKIDDYVFDRYINLRILNLNANQIDDVTNRTFSQSSRLENLTMYQNRLTRIKPYTFRACIQLKLLNLGANRLKRIEPDSFSGLKSLEVLDLAGNRIDRLNSDSFKDLQNIRWIYLKGNPLVIIETNLFNNLVEPPHTDISLPNNSETTTALVEMKSESTSVNGHENPLTTEATEETTNVATTEEAEEPQTTLPPTIDPELTTVKPSRQDLPCCNQTILGKQLMLQFQLYQKQLLEQFQSYQNQLQQHFEMIQSHMNNELFKQ